MLICIVLIMLSGLVQSFVIYPIEKYYFESSIVEYVSWLYIPRAFHVFVVMLLGFLGLIPLFIGSLVSTFFYSSDLYNNIVTAASVTLAMAFALSVINYVCGRKWHSSAIFRDNTGWVFRIFVAIHLVSSLANTMIRNYLYLPEGQNLTFSCFLGDTFGGVLVIFVFLLFRKRFFNRLKIIDGGT